MTTKTTPEQKVNGDAFLDFLFERRQTMSDNAGKFGERANQPPNPAAPWLHDSICGFQGALVAVLIFDGGTRRYLHSLLLDHEDYCASNHWVLIKDKQ